ncbi:HNH endonuclease [Microbacterium hydrocarbonoxydans]|uniref:HNH endonuclease n=1 Tax=Microbacterium hydrocarbonoxydans TaxID=273678 RepID=UPI003D98FF33
MVRRSSSVQDRHRARHRATRAACHICGRPIDYTLKWPDPMSFVVDHVVPLAKGGSHSFDNTAAAHAECNSKKRARLVAPIIKRSGTLR